MPGPSQDKMQDDDIPMCYYVPEVSTSAHVALCQT